MLYNILREWMADPTPIEDDLNCVYGKEFSFARKADMTTASLDSKITVVLRDRYTHVNGLFCGKSYVGVFLLKSLDDIECEKFRLWLKEFTEESMRSRREELQSLRETGQNIEFRPE